MGHLDQFAKDTFAQETAAVTHSAVVWQLPPELGMTEVRLDRLLRVVNPAPLAALAAPWSRLDQADELVLEVKMQGDHLDVPEFDRALLRRLVLAIARMRGNLVKTCAGSARWPVPHQARAPGAGPSPDHSEPANAHPGRGIDEARRRA